jgi:hypothetical protein
VFHVAVSFLIHLRSLPSTACFSTRTRPLPAPPPLRLFLSQPFPI